MNGEPLQAKEGMTRRRFMAFSGWFALGAATLGTPLAAQAVRFNKDLTQVTGGRITMGTFVNMIIFHPSKDQAQEAMAKAFDEMDRTIRILDCHDASSPISYLNQTGSLRDVPPELSEVLNSSLWYHQFTSGDFDITIKPLLELYEENFQKHHTPPGEEQIAEALKRVGSTHIAVDGDGVRFGREQMHITLDGIAKGYIVDRAMEVLRSSGIQHALINAGGDIRVMGPRGDGHPWTIGIQDPWHKEKMLGTIELTQGSVATSGNYEVYFDREKLYHHIISPRGGKPAAGPVSVSIVAPDTMTADALSTSVFVVGVGKGTALMKSMPPVGGLIITSDQRHHSWNWPKPA